MQRQAAGRTGVVAFQLLSAATALASLGQFERGRIGSDSRISRQRQTQQMSDFGAALSKVTIGRLAP